MMAQSMKRFFIAVPKEDGSVELHPMKEWLRQHPSEVPDPGDKRVYFAAKRKA